MREQPEQPLSASRFRVVIAGREYAFAAIEGLASETDDEGRARLHNVIMRRAVGRNRDLFEWRQAVAGGKDEARDVRIDLIDGQNQIAGSWLLRRARPMRWSGPSFNAVSDDVALEEVELAYERLSWVDDA